MDRVLLQIKTWCCNLKVRVGLKQRIGGLFRRSAAKSGPLEHETGSDMSTTRNGRPISRALSVTKGLANGKPPNDDSTLAPTASISKNVIFSNCTDSSHDNFRNALCLTGRSISFDRERPIEPSTDLTVRKQLVRSAGIMELRSSLRPRETHSEILPKSQAGHGAGLESIMSLDLCLVKRAENDLTSKQLQHEINELRAKRANLTVKIIRIRHDDMVARHKLVAIEKKLCALIQGIERR